MRKGIWISAMVAATMAGVSPAAAQGWQWQVGIGGQHFGGYHQADYDDNDELANRICSGQQAHQLEARIHHEVEEGDIDPDTAASLHQMVDRNEDYQRHACRSGNDWQLHDVARRYDWIGRRIHHEEDSGLGW